MIQDASVEGDFRRFREHVPAEDFFLKPNPARTAPALGPSGESQR